MICLDMYGMNEYQSEKARILYKGEKPNRHNIVQFIVAMTYLTKNLDNVDFREFVYKKPENKNDWMILWDISKKFDAILEYYNELIVWQPSWLVSLVSNASLWNAKTSGKLPQPFTYLNDGASYNNLLNGKLFHITWFDIIERKTFFEENEVVITQAFERALNGNNKICNKYFGSLGFYITRHWHDLQFAFALLDYLTIRITLDKYEKESCIWRTLEQHNIINNSKNCNEIRQTMVTIHKLHLSINAVNSILNFNSDSIATEKERAHNNYYNYWI